MGLLARRNLFHDKVRFAVTLTGIVFALVLIIIQFGLFLGFTTTTSNNIDRRFWRRRSSIGKRTRRKLTRLPGLKALRAARQKTLLLASLPERRGDRHSNTFLIRNAASSGMRLST